MPGRGAGVGGGSWWGEEGKGSKFLFDKVSLVLEETSRWTRGWRRELEVRGRSQGQLGVNWVRTGA